MLIILLPGVVWEQKELCERIKVQCELESAMELAKTAAVMKSQFLANMSHEVGKGEQRVQNYLSTPSLIYIYLYNEDANAIECHSWTDNNLV